jgi:hypothetical protein
MLSRWMGETSYEASTYPMPDGSSKGSSSIFSCRTSSSTDASLPIGAYIIPRTSLCSFLQRARPGERSVRGCLQCARLMCESQGRSPLLTAGERPRKNRMRAPQQTEPRPGSGACLSNVMVAAACCMLRRRDGAGYTPRTARDDVRAATGHACRVLLKGMGAIKADTVANERSTAAAAIDFNILGSEWRDDRIWTGRRRQRFRLLWSGPSGRQRRVSTKARCFLGRSVADKGQIRCSL